MAQAIPFIISGLQAASGVVSYISATNQAKQLEINADVVEQQARDEAVIEFNNSLGQEQELAFQSSVVEANKARAMQEAAAQREAFNRKNLAKISEAEVSLGYGGTFDSYIDSLELEAFENDNAMLLQLSDTTSSAFMQQAEFSRQMNVINANSEAKRRNILYGAEVQATNLRNQASQAKTAGFVNMLGSFASAGASYVQTGGTFTGTKTMGLGSGSKMGILDTSAYKAATTPNIARV